VLRHKRQRREPRLCSLSQNANSSYIEDRCADCRRLPVRAGADPPSQTPPSQTRRQPKTCQSKPRHDAQIDSDGLSGPGQAGKVTIGAEFQGHTSHAEREPDHGRLRDGRNGLFGPPVRGSSCPSKTSHSASTARRRCPGCRTEWCSATSRIPSGRHRSRQNRPPRIPTLPSATTGTVTER